jgi:hypothetical protein
MAALNLNLKISGATSAQTPTNVIATQAVEFWDDGSWQFVINGKRYRYAGQDQEVNKLLTVIFTGAGGLTGRKLFSA